MISPLHALIGASSTAVQVVSRKEGRKVVVHAEDLIKSLPQIEPPLEHGFAPGVYARKMFIAAGVAVSGKVHKYAHWNVVLRGKIVVMTETGTKEITAPAMFVSPAGTKRIGYAVEDTEWVTIHPTDETDVEKIENDIAVDTYEELSALTFDGEFSK